MVKKIDEENQYSMMLEKAKDFSDSAKGLLIYANEIAPAYGVNIAWVDIRAADTNPAPEEKTLLVKSNETGAIDYSQVFAYLRKIDADFDRRYLDLERKRKDVLSFFEESDDLEQILESQGFPRI